MDHDDRRFDEVMRLFEDGLRQPADRREAYLAEACPDDSVREEVRALLAHHGRLPDSFMAAEDTSGVFDATRPPARDASAADDPMIGRTVGNCTVLRLLDHGGMGSVYLAHHETLGTRVALKILRPGVATPAALERFELEARTLSRLNHPGIASVYEIGCYTDRGADMPYFAMEYVSNARSLIDHAAAKALGHRERLELFAEVCDAVYHGHQRGVFHRDLKPSNILVDRSGRSKIIDFGVAKVTDADKSAISIAEIVGTLQYMSPEQFDVDSDDLDARSDVYALGLILYELLCGRRPYEVRAGLVAEAARLVHESTPPPLSSIDRVLRGDVETIVGKALEKDRDRRYLNAAELARDIRSFLNDDPITAHPPSLRYQLFKMAKKRKGAFGAAAAVLVALVTGLVTTSLGFAEADHQATMAGTIADFVVDDLLGAVDVDSDLSLDESLDRAAASLDGDEPIEPFVEARLRTALGQAFLATGFAGRAEAQLRRAHAVSAAHDGPDHAETMTALRRLGLVHSTLRRHDDAVSALRRVLAHAERGDDEATTIAARAALGLALSGAGAYPEAETLLRRTVADRTRLHGPDDPLTLLARENLAGCLSRSRRYDLAAREYEALIEVARERHGDEHPATINMRNSVAVTHQGAGTAAKRAGDAPAADAAFGRALAIHEAIVPVARRVFHRRHRTLGSILNGYGASLYTTGDLDRAERVLLDAFELFHDRYGLKNRMTQRSVDLLVRVNRNQGDAAGLEEWCALLSAPAVGNPCETP